MASNGIPITSLIDIGGNLAGNTVFPVVDVSGNTTNKASIDALSEYLFQSNANALLDGITASNITFASGTTLGDGVSPAAFNISTEAGVGLIFSVDGNAQSWVYDIYGNLTFPDSSVQNTAWLGTVAVANVTGLGNIAEANFDGNTSNVLSGDGTFVPLPAISGNIANTNFDGNMSNVLIGTGSFGPVPGLGNVGTLNLDGNASNLLYGNGSFAAPPPTDLSGDGGNLSNLQGANVSGEVSYAAVANSVSVSNVSGIGSIATINTDGDAGNVLLGNGTFGAVPGLGNVGELNLDGNSSNILYGNGSFSSAPSVSLTGDGGNISNIQGANVSGAVAYATTANSVAVGNVSGIGNIATVNLSGNASNVLLGNGTFGAVPGLGNVGGTSFDGNASNVLYGNGVFAAGGGGGGGSSIANGNSNVSIATANGNVTFGVTGNANVAVVTGNGIILERNDIHIPATSTTITLDPTDWQHEGITSKYLDPGVENYIVRIAPPTGIEISHTWLGNSNVPYTTTVSEQGITVVGSGVGNTLSYVSGSNVFAQGIISANGNVVSNSFIKSGAVTYANTVGTSGQVLTTDGAGNTYWSSTGGGGGPTSAIVNGTSNVSISSPNANVTIGVGGTSNVVIADNSGNLTVKGTIKIPASATAGSLLSNNSLVFQQDGFNSFTSISHNNFYITDATGSGDSSLSLYSSELNMSYPRTDGQPDKYLTFRPGYLYSAVEGTGPYATSNNYIYMSSSSSATVGVWNNYDDSYSELSTNYGLTVGGPDGSGNVLSYVGANSWTMYTEWSELVFDVTSNATSNTATANLKGTFIANNVAATNAFQLPVYADNTARDTAVVTPTTGMMVFVTGSGMQVYGATQWNAVSGTNT